MPTSYELPNEIEKILRLVSVQSKNDGNSLVSRIIVNGKLRIEENHSYDNWDGGITGHALYFSINEPLFLEAINKKDETAKYISQSINKMKSIQDEFIHEVFFELSDENFDENWREKSNLYELPRKVQVIEEDKSRIWGVGGLKVFLSHKTEYKRETAELKESLKPYGISCFVAHEDIEATLEWHNEIERALFSMDVLIALLTKEFHNSIWTDQETGVAIGRQVPIVSVRIGRDPYGFIGKFQAVNDSAELPNELLKIFFTNRSIKPKMVESFIQAIRPRFSICLLQ